jgi:hypothetical protein
MTAAAMATVAMAPSAVHAGGFEFSGAGTRPLGRGGAFAARADDGMALLYNPAMIADLPDTQITLNAGLAIWSACVQRSGHYGDSLGGHTDASGTYQPGMTAAPSIFDSPGSNPDAWTASAYPSVCNSGPPQVLPQIVMNVRLANDFGLAFGILAPNGVGASQWGSANGTVTMAGDTTGNALRPSPTRYALTDANALLFYPSIGFGWRPIDWLRVGLTFQWGIGIISFSNYTSSASGGADPSSDIRTQLQNMVSPFIPAGILSVHFVPHENLDIMLGGRISDGIGGVVPATGSLTLTTSAYGNGSMMSNLPQSTTINGTTLHAGQPWQFWTGFRYGHRIRPRAYTRPEDARLRPGPDDPMSDELFDIELDVVYEYNQQVTDFVVTNPPGSMAQIQMFDHSLVGIPVPRTLPIAHGWSDDIVFRLGGDANIIPGVLALRAGASLDLPLNRNYVQWMTNDYIQGWRVGVHVGGTVRIDNHFDLSIAYAHIFAETVSVNMPSARLVAATGNMGQCTGAGGSTYDPNNPVTQRGCFPSGFGATMNGGSYWQMFDVVSLSGTYHFD